MIPFIPAATASFTAKRGWPQAGMSGYEPDAGHRKRAGPYGWRSAPGSRAATRPRPMSRCWSGPTSCAGRWRQGIPPPMAAGAHGMGLYRVGGAVPADAAAQGADDRRALSGGLAAGAGWGWRWRGAGRVSTGFSIWLPGRAWRGAGAGWFWGRRWPGLVLRLVQALDGRFFAYYLMHDYAFTPGQERRQPPRTGGADGRFPRHASPRRWTGDWTRCWWSAIPRARIWACRCWPT
jgi:hypothetical protein